MRFNEDQFNSVLHDLVSFHLPSLFGPGKRERYGRGTEVGGGVKVERRPSGSLPCIHNPRPLYKNKVKERWEFPTIIKKRQRVGNLWNVSDKLKSREGRGHIG